MTDHQTLLLQVSGPDRSGIVAGVLGTLAAADANVQDVEQIVIRGRISLSLVVQVPPGQDVLKELLLFGWEHDLEVDFDIVEADHTERRVGWVVTIVGPTLNAVSLFAVATAIAEAGGNIDRIERLARFPVWSYELSVSADAGTELKQALLTLAAGADFDVAVQREGLARRGQRLVILDVDSTLIQNEVIDLLADVAGCGTEVAALTEAAMRGELDFEQSVRQRVRLLAGQPVEIIDQAWARLRLTPGARTFVRTLKTLGFQIAIISGGFTAFTDRLRTELELDHAFANQLEQRRGILTGELTGPIIDRQAKGDLLRQLANELGISTRQVIAIGDGANDLEMLDAAGLGIAFNAKPVVQQSADTSLSVPYLDAVLFLLGVRREHVEGAGLSPSEPPR